MATRNPNFAKLQSGYLFPEISRRRREFQAKHPEVRVISLGIGDTTRPLTNEIQRGLHDAVDAMGTPSGYSGYGDEAGLGELRAAIAERFYNGNVSAEEVFVNDGAKPDIGRLQVTFGSNNRVAVQDPTYPVYVDSAVILGQTGQYDPSSEGFSGITYLPCRPDNGFFPDLAPAKDADLIFFCSPNNPTGFVADHAQLKTLVDFARENRAIILFDAAYSEYVSDPALPRSIYEVEGAREVAIEMNSFSKTLGFTGVRLGWTVVPRDLTFEDGSRVIEDYSRVVNTLFNGASIFAQRGGLAALTSEMGMDQMRAQIASYMENAGIIRIALNELGFETYGGDNAPYLWARYPGVASWDMFDRILEHAHVVCTPGAGFGPAGEGFVRFSAFGNREDVEEAVKRLKQVFGK